MPTAREQEPGGLTQVQMCGFKWRCKFGSVMGTALIASAPGRRLGKKGTNFLGNLSVVECRGQG